MSRTSDYFVNERERFMGRLPEVQALVEPKRIQTPPGYDSAHGLGAATYMMSQQYRLTRRDGGQPLELSGVTIAYELVKHKMPVFYVSEALAKAAAATQLPSDFLLSELFWPMPALVLGFPTEFMRNYADVDSSYVWCSHLDARQYPAPSGIVGPIIEPVFPKVALQYYRLHDSGQPEIFVGSFPVSEPVNDVVRRYAYVDHTDAGDTDILKERLHMVASLVFKVLLILSARDGLIQMGECVRPRSEKKGKVRDALWAPNFIGVGYRTAQHKAPGDGSAVATHWRRGHMTWQVIGTRADFVSANALPRDAEGGFLWAGVPAELKEKFLRSHRRTWIEPVLVGDL